MSGISTKNITSTFVPRDIKPGNVVAKINSLSIEESKTPKDASNPEYKIWIDLETKPLGNDFVGHDKVFGDPTKGKSLGQVKRIQFSNWPIKTNEGIAKGSGKPYKIESSETILDFLQKVLTIAGHEKYLSENDGKFSTWTEMFAAINRAGMLKDKYFSWCLAGTESINAAKYPVYYMYLPDRRDASTPFAKEGELVTTFNAAVHLKKSAILSENASLNNGTDEAMSEDDEFTPINTNDDPFDDESLFDLED